MAQPNYLHGIDGGVTVAGVALEATEWSGNPFEVEKHVFATFMSQGAQTGLGGVESGRDISITVKAKAEDEIRAAASGLKERAIVTCELKEPGMTTGHTGDLLLTSVMPARVAANAELEYMIRGTSLGKWTRGEREADTVSGGGG